MTNYIDINNMKDKRIFALLFFIFLCVSGLKGQNLVIPAGTQVSVKPVTEMKMDKDDSGKQLLFEVAEHFIMGDRILIPIGSIVRAHILEVRNAAMLGTGGKSEIQFDNITLANGRLIPLSDVPVKIKGKNNHVLSAATSMFYGLGVLVKGKKARLKDDMRFDVVIPADVTFMEDGNIVVADINSKYMLSGNEYMATEEDLDKNKEDKDKRKGFNASLLFGMKKSDKGNVRVKLTGSVHEKVTISFEDGRTEEFASLPYEFDVKKSDLPLKVSLFSQNYEYKDIDIEKKPEGGIGHIYMVHAEEKNVSHYANNVIQHSSNVQNDINLNNRVEKNIGIDWNREINKAPNTGIKAENTFALIIANENYDIVAPVAMANNDGEVFKEYCKKTLGLNENCIKYYPDATYGNMSRAFREIKEIAEVFNGDINLIFYYAGHGIPDNSTKDAYLMPVDADGTDMTVCYSLGKIYSDIEALKLKQCVVFMDACFSGTKRDNGMIVAARGVAIKPKEEKPKSSTVVFTASSDDEAAYSYNKEGHGLFTYFLLKKLQESNGKVSMGELAEYLKTKVAQNSILINGKRQTPTVIVSDKIATTWEKMKLTM